MFKEIDVESSIFSYNCGNSNMYLSVFLDKVDNLK